ncbi:esterase E4 [Neodiprion lecontei]|uniref:Carboxylic ester hydrolase n=1 Tax=Neodiprion lecontei TaxID=441921 RepID=A0ABM3GMQ1_NEOLC|nr:esterase E4 [Neodiprion lecontei]
MSDLLVKVEQGLLRGAVVKSVVGESYIAFKGVPYAAPPVGKLRFKDPEPLQPWTGIRDALEEGPKCAQFNLFTKSIIGDDDCLYLNLATPSLTGSRPVMVWIHGGLFSYGDGGSDIYSPDYLMKTDIVHVGINYRLGILGFLQLEHEAASGNMGLKDQIAALKWLKENIAQFGGDPNNITLFGQSAGAVSAQYLLLSPLAKGLFHKAIMQSGVLSVPWAYVSEPLKMAHRYVAAFGKDITDQNEIVEYLRTIPAHKLIEMQTKISTPEETINLVLPFGPTVDNKSMRPLMPKPIEELAQKGIDVPVIIGYTAHEGAIFFSRDFQPKYAKLDKNFEASALRPLTAKAPSKAAVILQEIRKFYFDGKPVTKYPAANYARYIGDLQFIRGVHRMVDIQREKKSPTYLYRFAYDSPRSVTKIMYNVDEKDVIGFGVSHAEENPFLFYPSMYREHVKMEPGSPDQMVSDRLIRLWTNFAKTGNPTPLIDDLITTVWKPVTKATKNYLEINEELFTGEDLDEEMCETWKRIEMVSNTSSERFHPGRS